MPFRSFVAATVFLGVFNTGAMAAERWYASSSMGVDEALVRNAAKGALVIACASGSDAPSASFDIDMPGVSPAKDETVAVDFQIDSQKLSFITDELRFEAHSKAEIDQLKALVGALSAGKSKTFEIFLPKTGKKTVFSLARARQSLNDQGQSILAECMNPTERKPVQKDAFTPFELTPPMIELVKSSVSKSLKGADIAGYGDTFSVTKSSNAIHACGTVDAKMPTEKAKTAKRFHAILEKDGSTTYFVEIGDSPSKAETVAKTCRAVGAN